MLAEKELASDLIGLEELRAAGFALPAGPCCVVVIPAHNEEESLPAVLSAVPHSAAGLTLVPLVIADGCDDATEEVARQGGATVLSLRPRRGSGAAVRLGFRAAVVVSAAVVVTLDADGQHDPAEIPRLLERLVHSDADVVQGSRVLGVLGAAPRLRRLGIGLFARVISRATGTRITDPSTGFRAIKTNALTGLDLRQDQFYVSELIVEAARKGLKIAEVPTTGRARSAGKSKKPRSLGYAWGFGKALVRTWLR